MLSDLVVELLTARPGQSARELVVALGRAGHPVDKSRVNSLLYSRIDLFRNNGDIPPRWSLADHRVQESARTPYRVAGLSVQNWKSFEDADAFFAGVTLIFGENSSGKSSLFQALLLMKQSWGWGSLRLEGEQASFGWYQHVVHRQDLERDLSLMAEWGGEVAEDSWTIMLTAPAGDPAQAFNPWHPVERIVMLSPGDVVTLQSTNAISEDVPPQLADCWVVIRGDDVQSLTMDGDSELPYLDDQVLVLGSDEQGFPRVDDVVLAVTAPGSEPTHDQTQTLSLVEKVLNGATEVFASLQHLGPARTVPNRDISLSWARQHADYLARIYEEPDLLADVNEYLRKFEVPYSLQLTPYGDTPDGDPLFELHLRRGGDEGETVVLRDVGFGVSQLLPIVVTLLGSREKTIMLEEPEAHIHPRLQGVLGDLLITSAEDYGNVLLVETHSEPILLRLQRRIAEGRITADDVGVLHVTRDSVGSRIAIVDIKPNGQLDYQWPGGFFDDRIGDLVAILDPRPSD